MITSIGSSVSFMESDKTNQKKKDKVDKFISNWESHHQLKISSTKNNKFQNNDKETYIKDINSYYKIVTPETLNYQHISHY